MPRLALITLLLLPRLALAEAVSEVPTTYVLALPAAVSLVAWLPVVADKRGRDLIDLDLRIEVVLPLGCGDQVAGLARRGGARLDGADAWDVIVARRSVGECKRDPTRVARRWAIRMRLPEAASRELVIGERGLKVARRDGKVTLDGEPPTGDVPGAPPTDPPRTFVVGAVTAAQITAARGVAGEPAASTLEIDLAARWPRCAGPALGLLGRGDAASKFRLAYFDPIAVAPLDGACPAAEKPRRETVRLVWRGGHVSPAIGALRPPLPSLAK